MSPCDNPHQTANAEQGADPLRPDEEGGGVKLLGFLEARDATNSAAYLLPALAAMARSSPPPPLRLLDVGAGPGSISVHLAELIGPAGRVLAIDANPSAVARARAIVATREQQQRQQKQQQSCVSSSNNNNNNNNIVFELFDASRALPFADGAFDVVHCHQVLLHNRDPVAMLREMLRVAKAGGGVVAVREADVDTEMWWPRLPGLQKWHDDYTLRTIAQSGGCSSAGRQLIAWAVRAGALRSQITPSYSTWSFTTPEEREFWVSTLVDGVCTEPVRSWTKAATGLTEGDMDGMAAAWREWMQTEDATLAVMHGELLIRK